MDGISIQTFSKNDKTKLVREEYKNNPRFYFNSFNKPMELSNMDAIISQISDLLLTDPYTHPDNPYYGIGVKKYLFEYADAKTLNTMKTEIAGQIGKYINPDLVLDILIKSEIDPLDIYTTYLLIGMTIKNNFEVGFTTKSTFDFFTILSKDNQNKIRVTFHKD